MNIHVERSLKDYEGFERFKALYDKLIQQGYSIDIHLVYTCKDEILEMFADTMGHLDFMEVYLCTIHSPHCHGNDYPKSCYISVGRKGLFGYAVHESYKSTITGHFRAYNFDDSLLDSRWRTKPKKVVLGDDATSACIKLIETLNDYDWYVSGQELLKEYSAITPLVTDEDIHNVVWDKSFTPKTDFERKLKDLIYDHEAYIRFLYLSRVCDKLGIHMDTGGFFNEREVSLTGVFIGFIPKETYSLHYSGYMYLSNLTGSNDTDFGLLVSDRDDIRAQCSASRAMGYINDRYRTQPIDFSWIKLDWRHPENTPVILQAVLEKMKEPNWKKN